MPKRVPGWGGRVILDVGSLLFVGPGGVAEQHAHHAVQLVWAQEGEFTITLDQPLQRRAVLVPAGGAGIFDVKIDEPGLYPFVSHAFAHVDLGQVGLLKVGKVDGTMSH